MAALYVLDNLLFLMQKKGEGKNPWDTCDNIWTATPAPGFFAQENSLLGACFAATSTITLYAKSCKMMSHCGVKWPSLLS
jgi:hypothetical protein